MTDPILRTPRLLLRPLTQADAAAVMAYAGDPTFFRFIEDAPSEARRSYRLEHAKGHIGELRALARRGYPHWGIVPLQEPGLAPALAPGPVGAVRFRPYGPAGLPELGYGIHPHWTGRGLVTEAAQAALDQLAAPAVVARCHPGNLASLRVLGRLGFTPAGRDEGGRPLFERHQPPRPPGAKP